MMINGKDDRENWLRSNAVSAGSALCAGCQQIADKPDQWCDMFRVAPEGLPCTQHDQFAPIREAMVKTGMAKLVIAAAVIGMPNDKAETSERSE